MTLMLNQRENIHTFHKRNTHASIYNSRHALLIQEGRKVGTFLGFRHGKWPTLEYCGAKEITSFTKIQSFQPCTINANGLIIFKFYVN